MKPAAPVHSTRPRVHHNASTASRPPTSSLSRTRLTSSARTVLKAEPTTNRRYAAVLSHLNKPTRPKLASALFSGYVPKSKQDGGEQQREMAPATASRVDGSPADQHKAKVSFCLDSETGQGKTFRGRKVNSRHVVTTSVQPSVTLTNSEAPTSSTSSPPVSTTVTDPVVNVADIPCTRMPADSNDISLLCEELFVANNTSFCDQLLESCPLPQGQPTAPLVVPDASLFSSSKKDIPEPVTDFSFDDFVEFEELFGGD